MVRSRYKQHLVDRRALLDRGIPIRNLFTDRPVEFHPHQGWPRVGNGDDGPRRAAPPFRTSSTLCLNRWAFNRQRRFAQRNSQRCSFGKLAGASSLPDGRIQLVGNNGVDNAISISLSALKLTPADNSGVTSPNLGFGSVQSAQGQSAAADFIVYDSLGIPLNVRVTAVLESRDSTTTTYRWFADSTDNDPATGANISVGTGQIKFDGEGNVIAVTNSTVAVDRSHVYQRLAAAFDLDFTNISGLAANSAHSPRRGKTAPVPARCRASSSAKMASSAACLQRHQPHTWPDRSGAVQQSRRIASTWK